MAVPERNLLPMDGRRNNHTTYDWRDGAVMLALAGTVVLLLIAGCLA